jgi:ubiquinone biosynthesis protein
LNLIGLDRKYRNIQRLRQIINVFIKHGFGQFIDRLNLSRLVSIGKRIIGFKKFEDFPSHTKSKRFRLALEELGPTFVKFGQLLSSRPDLIPGELAEELKKLQDEVPPLPFEEIQGLLEEELGSPVAEVFGSFNPRPYAAASIAQVYEATLKQGDRVMVKVQRSGIKRIIEDDISILFYLAHLLEKYAPETRLYNPVGMVEEFSQSIRRELDFMLEASNLERMREIFQGDRSVYIPRVYWELTSQRVLVLEQVEGIPVDEVDRLTAVGLDRRQIAKSGCRAFLKQVFEFGFFHADPHPGNILIMSDGTVAFVDFGIMGRLDTQLRTHIANVFLALIDRDYERLVNEYLMMGYISPETDINKFKSDIIDLIDPYYGQPLKNIKVGALFSQTAKLMVKYRVEAPVDLMLLIKTLVFVEGIGRQLDIDFNLLEMSKPYAVTLLKQRYHPQRLLSLVTRQLAEFGDLFKVLPQQSQIILRRLLEGKLELGISHLALEELIKDRRESANRLAFALIIAALIIGSCLIIQANRGPFLFGIPALGLMGFAIGFLLGVWLIISMFFSRLK